MATRGTGTRGAFLLLPGFAATMALGLWTGPTTGFMGTWIAACSTWLLLGNQRAAAALAGSCAALAAVLAMAQGLPFWLGIPGALIVPLLAQYLARTRAGFAPARMTDEALCGLVIAALLLSAAPLVDGGWRNAVALNRGSADASVANHEATWVWYVAAAGFAAGLLGGWLKRR
jgi:hypothetical protein